MRPRLRASFVVTAAVMAAMTTACSSDDSHQITNPPPPGGIDSAVPDYGFDVARDDTSSDAANDGNPTACPATDPGIGAAKKPCTAAASIRCAYEDLCPQHPTGQTQNVYTCFDDGTGDHWTLVSKPYVPTCPTLEPKTGDACPCTIHMGYVACNYGDCEAFTRTYAACKGVDTFETTWNVVPIMCNPPEPDAGADVADGD